MELLDGYGSSSSSEETPRRASPPPPKLLCHKVNPAPLVLRPLKPSSSSSIITSRANPFSAQSSTNNNQQLVLTNNPLKSQLQPLQGPAHPDPHGPKPQSRGILGHTESNFAFEETTFDEQRKAFQKTGVALGPDEYGTEIRAGPTESNWGATQSKKRKLELENDDNDDDDVLVEGSDDEQHYGIWGPPTSFEVSLQNDSVTDAASNTLTEPQLAERSHIAERDRRRGALAPDDEEAEQQLQDSRHEAMLERKMSHLLPPRLRPDAEPVQPSTKFHGPDEVDYLGRPWTHPPAGTPTQTPNHKDRTSYVPKKCVHRFTGHNKGVQRIRLLPHTGHLLLSAGLDGKLKVWSISLRRVMRTYIGHAAAITDANFDNDGRRFVSSSFDRYVRVWDTQSGSVVGTYTNRKVPYVVKFYPKNNEFFVAGCSDHKVVSYNVASGEIAQEYNHHLGPVNTITFCEDATKMLTSSDDKKILVWEWDIGVPIKYISDPSMYSIPVFTVHPSGLYLLGQSLDNQIVVYQARDKFTLMKKKKFVGHSAAGYACDLDVSADGRFVVSGDGSGRLFFWDWRMHKILQKYRAHDKGPCMGVVWHPTEPSTVFSCGWDGVIKMWQ